MFLIREATVMAAVVEPNPCSRRTGMRLAYFSIALTSVPADNTRVRWSPRPTTKHDRFVSGQREQQHPDTMQNETFTPTITEETKPPS